MPRHVAKLWNVKSIYITENGTSGSDQPADGTVYDVDRIMYLRNYLTHLQRATSEGVPVLGYFLWSLMDNFEWSDGFEQRFGLYHVDFDTKRRTPKLSASFIARRSRETRWRSPQIVNPCAIPCPSLHTSSFSAPVESARPEWGNTP